MTRSHLAEYLHPQVEPGQNTSLRQSREKNNEKRPLIITQSSKQNRNMADKVWVS